MVGNTSSISPAFEDSRAPAGVNQPTSTHSSPSTLGSWPSGRTARKKWVSKRIVTTAGVIQRENLISSDGFASSMLGLLLQLADGRRAVGLVAGSLDLVHCASGEHPHSAHEPGLRGAPHKQHFEALATAAQQDHARCLAGRTGAPVLSVVPGSTPGGGGRLGGR